MRFVGKVALILVVVFAAAVAHSMVWPIPRDAADQALRERAKRQQEVPPVETDPASAQSRDPEDTGGGSDRTVDDPIDEPPVQDTDPPQPEVDLPEFHISVARAYELWEEGMPFVDARTDAERVVGTIEGAFHLETLHFVNRMEGPILDQLEPAFPVVVFCAGGDCDASENVAQRLIGRGYIEVYIMHDGFGAWKAAGHPTEPVGGG